MPTNVNTGDGFVFGIAYWPAGTLVNWGPPVNSTGAPGLNPCLTSFTWGNVTTNYQSYLSSQGVTFTTYQVTVDKMAAVRTTKAEEDVLWDPILGLQKTEVLSVIAFRGQNRSDPRYIRSNSAAQTSGTGIVQQTSLLVGFDRGSFAGFSWYDFGECTACGGLVSDTCIRTDQNDVYQQVAQSSCAAAFADCTCRGLNCAATNCSTTIVTAFQGSDASGRALTSGYQIQNLNNYSISDFFSNLIDKLSNVLPGIKSSSSSGSSVTISGATTDAQLQQAQSR